MSLQHVLVHVLCSDHRTPRDVLTTQVIQLTSHADVMLGQLALKNIKHRDRALMFKLEMHFALNTLHTNVLPQPVGLQSV